MFICTIIVVVANVRLDCLFAGMYELHYCNATIGLKQSTGSLALIMC